MKLNPIYLSILPEPLIIDNAAASIFQPITNRNRYKADIILLNIQSEWYETKLSLLLSLFSLELRPPTCQDIWQEIKQGTVSVVDWLFPQRVSRHSWETFREVLPDPLTWPGLKRYIHEPRTFKQHIYQFAWVRLKYAMGSILLTSNGSKTQDIHDNS